MVLSELVLPAARNPPIVADFPILPPAAVSNYYGKTSRSQYE